MQSQNAPDKQKVHEKYKQDHNAEYSNGKGVGEWEIAETYITDNCTGPKRKGDIYKHTSARSRNPRNETTT